MYELSSMRLMALDETDDMEAASLVQHQLSQLDMYALSFEAALSLADFARSQFSKSRQQAREGGREGPLGALEKNSRVSLEWVQIAHRDAVMTVFHFGVALKSINFKNLSRFRENVDHKFLKRARTAFDEFFPDAVQTRNAVGHAAERLSTRKKANDTFIDGDRYSITNSVVGGRMTSTVKHPHTKITSVVSVALSQTSLDQLNTIRDLVQKAFAPLEADTERRIMSRLGLN